MEPWRQQFFFPVSFKPPQNDNIPLHGRRWKVTAKMTLSWKLLGGEFTSNFLSCPLDLVHKIFVSFFPQEDYNYLGAQRTAGMWMSSKRCQLQGEGVLPHISGNRGEQAKHCDRSSRARADTEKQQPGRDSTSCFWTSGDEGCCMVSVK